MKTTRRFFAAAIAAIMALSVTSVLAENFTWSSTDEEFIDWSETPSNLDSGNQIKKNRLYTGAVGDTPGNNAHAWAANDHTVGNILWDTETGTDNKVWHYNGTKPGGYLYTELNAKTLSAPQAGRVRFKINSMDSDATLTLATRIYNGTSNKVPSYFQINGNGNFYYGDGDGTAVGSNANQSWSAWTSGDWYTLAFSLRKSLTDNYHTVELSLVNDSTGIASHKSIEQIDDLENAITTGDWNYNTAWNNQTTMRITPGGTNGKMDIYLDDLYYQAPNATGENTPATTPAFPFTYGSLIPAETNALDPLTKEFELTFTNVPNAKDFISGQRNIVLKEGAAPLNDNDYQIIYTPGKPKSVTVSVKDSYNNGKGLKKGTTYNLELTSGLVDMLGQSITNSQTFSYTTTNDAVPPNVSLVKTNPAGDTLLQGVQVTLTATVTAVEDIAIEKVEYYNGSTLLYTDGGPANTNGSTYTSTYTFTPTPDAYAVTAKAYYTNDSVNAGASSAVNFTVSAATAPVITFLSPAEGGKMGQNVFASIKGKIETGDGQTITGATISIDGGAPDALTLTDGGASVAYNFVYETPGLAYGTHTATVSATKQAGNSGAGTINFNVVNMTAGNLESGTVEIRPADFDQEFSYSGSAVTLPGTQWKVAAESETAKIPDGYDKYFSLTQSETEDKALKITANNPSASFDIKTEDNKTDLSNKKLSVRFNAFLGTPAGTGAAAKDAIRIIFRLVEPSGTDFHFLRLQYNNTLDGANLRVNDGTTRETFTNHSINLNEWLYIQADIDTAANVFDVYVNGVKIVSKRPFTMTTMNWSGTSGQPWFRIVNNFGNAQVQSVTWLDDLQISQYDEGFTPSFASAQGWSGVVSTDAQNAPRDLSAITVSFPVEMKGNSFDGNVTVTVEALGTEKRNAKFEGELQANGKDYVITLDEKAVYNGTYEITFGGNVESTANKKQGNPVKLTVVTNALEFYIAESFFKDCTDMNRIERIATAGGDGVFAYATPVLAENAAASRTVYVIAALYEGDLFIDIALQVFTVTPGSAAPRKVELDLTKITDITKASAKVFVWDGLNSAVPLYTALSIPY
jgi:hypothetical protein